MQTKFSIISNIIFKYFLFFIIAFLWLKYYVNNLIVISILSIIISLIIGKIFALIYKKKKNTLILALKEQEHIKNISFQLLLTDIQKIINFYAILLGAKRQVELSKDKLAILWENNAFIPIYNTSKISSDTIAFYYKKFKDYTNIIIAGISFSDDALLLCEQISNTKITLLNETQTFKLFKKYDYYPDFKIEILKKEKFKLSKLHQIIFLKSNFRRYFCSGLIILITSFFIRYNLYYLIFATLLFIFSGISFFKPLPKASTIEEEL